MKMIQAAFNGDPNIGMYGFSTEKNLISGMEGVSIRAIEDHMKVTHIESKILGTGFLGIFSTGNDSGLVVSKNSYDTKIDFNNILSLDTEYTTIGNMIIMNNNGIVISPMIEKFKQIIEKFFGLDAEVTKIAGLNIIGSLGIANDKGCLTHPEIKEDEKKIIEKTLGVTLNVGTVSYGSPYVRSGIIANNKSIVVSEASTGYEIGRIMEALQIG